MTNPTSVAGGHASRSCPPILIIDDEAAIREQLAVALAQRGYRSELAETAVTGLERLEGARLRGQPHLCVILDVRLPDIDGLRLLEAIKTTYPDTPVIVISGVGQDYETRAVDHHQDCLYIDKPFDIELLAKELACFERRGGKLAPPPPRPFTGEPTRSAYVFVRSRSPRDLCAVLDSLRGGEGVCYCDVVQGEWDVVLLVQAPTRESLHQLTAGKLLALPGVERFEVHQLTRPLLSDELASFIRNHERMLLKAPGEKDRIDRRSRRQLSAYAMVGIEADALRPLYPQIYFNPRVLYCDVTVDGEGMVLFLQALSSDDLRRTGEVIRALPGVKQLVVLPILEGHE